MKKHTKRWLALTLAAALAVPTAVPTWASVEAVAVDGETDLIVEDVTQQVQEEKPEETDDSQEETEKLDYILGRPMTEEEKQEQTAPMENLTEILEEPMETEELDMNAIEEERVGASTYPAVYDLRPYTTPVKNQIQETCWVYSTIAAGETNLIMNDERYTTQSLAS